MFILGFEPSPAWICFWVLVCFDPAFMRRTLDWYRTPAAPVADAAPTSPTPNKSSDGNDGSNATDVNEKALFCAAFPYRGSMLPLLINATYIYTHVSDLQPYAPEMQPCPMLACNVSQPIASFASLPCSGCNVQAEGLFDLSCGSCDYNHALDTCAVLAYNRALDTCSVLPRDHRFAQLSVSYHERICISIPPRACQL